MQFNSYNEGDGFGVTAGRVRNQSLLAAKVGPPSAPENEFLSMFVAFLIAALMAGIISFIIYYTIALFGYDAAGKLTGILLGFGLTVGGTILVANKMIPDLRIREQQYNAAMRAWKRSWICLRCGEDWQPRPAVTTVNLQPFSEATN